MFNILAYVQAQFTAFPDEYNTDSKKIVYLAQKLEGKYRDWFSSSTVRDPTLLSNYNMFISKLLSFSGEADELEPFPTRFMGVVQDNETSISYNRRFRTLQTKL